jgi:hypothetical protein
MCCGRLRAMPAWCSSRWMVGTLSRRPVSSARRSASRSAVHSEIRVSAPLVTHRGRHCVRGVLQHRPFSPTGSLPSALSATAPHGFVRGFLQYYGPIRLLAVPRQLRLLDFLSRPGIAHATAGQTRSPRFRRVPFLRDVASDPGRATGPCIAAPHMLPSAPLTASAPAT